MGLIIRQSFKSTIASYLSAIIGLINVFVIYTTFLTPEELGKYQYITSSAFLITPLFTLGFKNTITKYFQKKEAPFQLLYEIFAVILIASCIYIIVLAFTYRHLDSEFSKYIILIVPIAFLNGFISILTVFSANLGRITVPSIIGKLIPKVWNMTFVILFGLGVISMSSLLSSIVVLFFCLVIFLIIYISILGKNQIQKPILKFINLSDKKLIHYTLITLLTALGGVLMTKLDSVVISEVLGFEKNGMYTIAILCGGLLMLPTAALFNISGPIISRNLNKGNLGEVANIYKRGSSNLFLVTAFLSLLISSNIQELFSIMPNGETFYYSTIIFLFILGTKTLDNLTSLNGVILIYSSKYKIHLAMILITGLLNLILTILFARLYGLNGVAAATFTSLLIFNAAKTGYVYKKFNMHPFERKQIVTAVAVILAYLLLAKITISNPYLSASLKGLIIFILFFILIFKFEVSEEIKNLTIKGYSAAKKKITSLFYSS